MVYDVIACAHFIPLSLFIVVKELVRMLNDEDLMVVSKVKVCVKEYG